ncbi:MAG TPA: PQQ-dependent sugar dehydrogenase, partial [Dehalococcoidia bacterium]|nr:PQQ-dependent sugar dehydrogenase [Dehalococcoidia bacterium]
MRLPFLMVLIAAGLLAGACSVLAGEEPVEVVVEEAVGEADASQVDGVDGEETADAGDEAETSVPISEPLAQVALEIELPPAMAAFVWAEEIGLPSSLAFSEDGRLWVGDLLGRIWTLRDRDGNGVAEERVLFAEGLTAVHGIAVENATTVYVSDRARVLKIEDLDGDGVGDRQTAILRNLPVGTHRNNELLLTDDGRLLLTLGSTCDDCAERSPLSAAILALDLSSSGLEIVASGLGNPFGLATTADGSLWVTDQQPDSRCGASDELNLLVEGGDYGWPYCEASRTAVREASAAAAALAPIARLGEHERPTGLTWLQSEIYPPELSGGFYVALSAAGRVV